MPKYSCACGYVMNLSHDWSSYELSLVPESVIEELGDRLNRGDVPSSENFYEVPNGVSTTVYRCPQCNRLHLEEESNRFITYIVEKVDLK